MWDFGVALLRTPFKRACCKELGRLTASTDYISTFRRVLKSTLLKPHFRWVAPGHWLCKAAVVELAHFCLYLGLLYRATFALNLTKTFSEHHCNIKFFLFNSLLFFFFLVSSIRHYAHIYLKAIYTFLYSLSFTRVSLHKWNLNDKSQFGINFSEATSWPRN